MQAGGATNAPFSFLPNAIHMGSSYRSVTILCVDDDPDFADLTATFLEREDEGFDVVTASSARDALELLDENHFDCIVSDYDMPGMNGIDFLRAVREDYPERPFVLFTGKGSEEVASEAISAGVTDYMQKESGTDHYQVLAQRVKNVVARHRVQESEARANTILEASPDPILVVIGQEIVFANPAAVSLAGADQASDLIGVDITALTHPDDVDDVLDAIRGVESNQTELDKVERRVQTLAGDPLTVEITARPITWEGEPGHVIIARDITERKQREQALHEGKERFELLVNEVRDYAIFMLDRDGHIITWNEGAEHIKGYDEEAILGEHFSTFYTDEDADAGLPDTLLAEAKRNGRVEDEGWRVRADGSRFWALVSITALYDDEGELRGFGKVTRDMTDRREEIERYVSLIEHSSDVITVIDEAGTIMFQSPSVEDVLGYSPEELVGESAYDYIHPDDRDRIIDTFTGLVGDPGDVIESERYRFRHSDGSWVWLESVGGSLEAQPLDGFVINSRDVTEQKNLEAELEATLRRYQTLVEQNLAGIYLVQDGMMAYVNQKFCKITGYSEEELLTMDALELVAPESRDEVAEHIQQRLSGDVEEVDYTTTLLRANGERREVRAHGSRIELEGTPAILGTIVDITEQVELHDQLVQERELLERVLATSPVGITILTPDGVIQRANRRAQELLGLTESEITDRRFDDPEWNIVDTTGNPIPDDELPFARVIDSGEPVLDYEHGIEWPDGTERWLSVNAAPLTDEDGNLERVVAVIVDVTERREYEEELQRQNERLDEFASIVSHDLRNPLNVAEGRLELAQADCDSDHLEGVGKAHERMSALIDDLLYMAREGQPLTDRQRIVLDEAVDVCWRNVDTSQATLVCDTNIVFEADESRLRQLLENLIRNAVEHGGDSVTVTVGRLPDGFYIEDDGPGIPADTRTDIFEAGYSTAPEGTGFGLSIVKTVTEAHGWAIEATAGDTGGARFEITGVGLD